MSTAIIDVREWQRSFDLRSGQPSGAYGPVPELLRRVLADHPYPGDMEMSSNSWVTDTALDLVQRYDPELAFLIYGHPYFANRHAAMTPYERRSMVKSTFDEVRRFMELSGFSAIIIGRGGMTPVEGFIDVSGLDSWQCQATGLPDMRGSISLLPPTFVASEGGAI
jgi:hypothetical protein